MDFLNLIISLISGAVGGNISGAALKDQSLGACSCKPWAHPPAAAELTQDR
jgi:hypothetical protein